MTIDRSERPNQIPWPPLLLAIAFLAGILLQWQLEIHWPGTRTTRQFVSLFGVFMMLSALLIDFVCFQAMRRHNTTILPNKGASHLLTSGPYRLSRNPIYVGNVLLVIGAGLCFQNAWLIFVSPFMAVAIHHLAIKREEAHLLANFEDDWQAYCKTTRRWV